VHADVWQIIVVIILQQIYITSALDAWECQLMTGLDSTLTE